MPFNHAAFFTALSILKRDIVPSATTLPLVLQVACLYGARCSASRLVCCLVYEPVHLRTLLLHHTHTCGLLATFAHENGTNSSASPTVAIWLEEVVEHADSGRRDINHHVAVTTW